MRHAIKTLLLAIPIGALSILTEQAGAIEGHYFPVVTNYTVTEITPSPDGHIAVSVQFEKIRNCKYMDQNWSVETQRGYWTEYEMITPEDGGKAPRSKAVGYWTAHWILQAPAGFIGKPMKATVYHSCWGPLFWTTETIIVEQPHEVP